MKQTPTNRSTREVQRQPALIRRTRGKKKKRQEIAAKLTSYKESPVCQETGENFDRTGGHYFQRLNKEIDSVRKNE